MTENVPALLAEFDTISDPKMAAINAKHGDAHSVNLTKLRAIAKRVKKQQPLARELWATEDPNGRLLALLICKPREFDRAELNDWLRGANTPKEQDWLVNYVVKKSKHSESLREEWFADADAVVASAGWALTSERVVKNPEGIDEPALLDQIEREMRDAPERLQWAMNQTLAEIGIANPELRERAIDIGERLEVLKDYPTPPNCTSPFAPIWITEIVRRNEAKA
jgi:3-methyladenine DNA glycosylase AlkD